MRSEAEIDEVLDALDSEAAAGGPSKWPGMNYEMGVEAALMWVTGRSSEKPTDD